MIITPGMLFYVALLGLYKADRNETVIDSLFVQSFSLSAFCTILIFFNLHYVHDYYQVAISPIMAILLGYGMYIVLQHLLVKKQHILIFMTIITFLLMFFMSSTYLINSWRLGWTAQYSPIMQAAQFIKGTTRMGDHILLADVDYEWSPAYLFYSDRVGKKIQHRQQKTE